MGPKAILLVESNKDDEILIVRALTATGNGGDVVVLRDGAEAAAYLFSPRAPAPPGFEAPPGMILLDPNIPKVEWTEILKRVRTDARTRRIPVIILASSSEEQIVIKSYTLGANSFVRKPVSYRRLTKAVGQLAGYWRELNETAPADEG